MVCDGQTCTYVVRGNRAVFSGNLRVSPGSCSWHGDRIAPQFLKEVRMGLSRRVALLGLVLFSFRPATAGAAAITTGVGGSSCTFVGATDACQTFGIGPIGPGTLGLTGAFALDNDIALFSFSVVGDVLFTATTSSFTRDANEVANGGFDPMLALYTSAGLLVQNGLSFAVNDDISFDTGLFNAQLSNVLLSSGNYLLALTQTGNNPQERLANCDPGADPPCTGGFDQAAAEFACYVAGLSGAECTAGAPGLFGGLAPDFALELQVEAVAAIPEPGTLVMLGSGVFAALARRRTKRSAEKGLLKA
jgi:hypothetical protein